MDKLKKDKAFERLSALSEGSIDDAKKALDVQAAEETKRENKNKTILRQARFGRIATYNRLLGKLLITKMNQTIDFPPGWSYQVAPTGKGVILQLVSPDKRIFRSGFEPTGMEEYDLNAVNVYVIRAMNTIDRVTGADRAAGRKIWTKNENN